VPGPGQPQTVTAARELESLVAASPGHDIVAGDLDGDCASDSLQFWTGRHVIDDTSVCYRSAWEAMHLAEPLATYLPENPHQVDVDWPIRGIDHVLVRCGPSDPALTIGGCRHVFDQGQRTPSDHYGLRGRSRVTDETGLSLTRRCPEPLTSATSLPKCRQVPGLRRDARAGFGGLGCHPTATTRT